MAQCTLIWELNYRCCDVRGTERVDRTLARHVSHKHKQRSVRRLGSSASVLSFKGEKKGHTVVNTHTLGRGEKAGGGGEGDLHRCARRSVRAGAFSQ